MVNPRSAYPTHPIPRLLKHLTNYLPDARDSLEPGFPDCEFLAGTDTGLSIKSPAGPASNCAINR